MIDPVDVRGEECPPQRLIHRCKTHIRAAAITICLLACGATCFGLAASYLRMKHVARDYQLLLAEQNAKNRQLTGLSAMIDELQTRIGQVEEGSESMMSRIGIDPAFGVGGPVVAKNRLFSSTQIKTKEDELVRDLWLRLQTLKVRNQEQASINQSIDGYLARKSELLSAIPAIQPVSDGWISSGFKLRKDPFIGQVRMHYGIDISTAKNTPVVATGAGTVIFAGWDGNFGKTIWIDHGFGFETKYAHLNDIKVTVNQAVSRGVVIGLVGNTGRSTGTHLHYEVHLEGRPINPLYFVQLLSSNS